MVAVERLADDLERIVDQASLGGVLAALVLVAHAKAEHLSVNWGDEGAAREWSRLAGKLERVADAVEKAGI